MRGLSAERERELVVATERGDRAACEQLVESFLPAIAGVARRFDAGGGVQRTELLQEGVAGLLFAARRYDPRMKTPLRIESPPGEGTVIAATIPIPASRAA